MVIETQLLLDIVGCAKAAGQRILQIYQHEDAVDVQHKADKTPVTIADLEGHQIIAAGLKQLTPDIPLLSEESPDIDYIIRSTWKNYWLVDPLDGTREFINRNGEFTVNIALIQDHQPVVGVIYIPVSDTCYYAEQGKQAYKQQGAAEPQIIRTREVDSTQIVAVTSRSHGSGQTQAYLDKIGLADTLRAGSSLKLCLLAEGKGDIYPRLAPTSEWDIAAAQCILEQAGGQVLGFDKKPLRYNTKSDLLNPYFLAIGDPNYNWHQYIEV